MESEIKLRFYNSLTGDKEDFAPLEDGHIGIYVCGITAYDYSHIGHARAAVVFDVLVRYLRYLGYKVTFVQNFTDVDDKIINRARELGLSSKEVAERFISEFRDDMEALGIIRPDVEPKATEHIKEIVDLIENLIRKGHAYEVEGNVYFAVDTFPEYGKLSGRSLEDMRAGARVEVDTRKRNPLDFALWKSGKPGEPTWQSPWGPGRPGWHIECSAMSLRYLGKTFDIHGGGKDLIFPHHENELAQSEAATGKPFVRFFIHNGFVTINAEKMSKSLGNFLTIREVVAHHESEALRLFLLSKHYRKPLDYSEGAFLETEISLDRLCGALNEAFTMTSNLPPIQVPPDLSSLPQEALEAYFRIRDLPEHFRTAMNDDLNTAQALAHVFDAVKGLNVLLEMAKKQKKKPYLEAISAGAAVIRKTGQIIGLLISEPAAYLSRRRSAKLKKLSISEDEILELMEQRQEARKAKDWTQADAVRDRLSQAGIMIKDTPQGTSWDVI